ncbi:carbohydrate binding domain-containing protein [Rhizobium rhizogenes]|uniref:carbohydrate binding domain-containing protein n=1 Tax=Rhizobium rhizogenes TaxID=359 RepID=UPI001573CDFB|nr:carbohydrate binding domain-containing protein [Rhizobium rhizogenes]NTF42537.1 hypothetical protein [Rhizobium rhizogenes]
MKYLILLLNVLCFWLMADAAPAAPLVAAIGAIAQLLPIGAIGKLFLTVALNIGLSLIEKALAKKDQPQPAGTKLEISMGDDHAMSFIIGSYATAGKRKYAGTWGDDGKTPNAYFTDVIEVGSLPNRAGERGLTSVWIDDQKVGVLWDQPHPDGRGFPVLQYRVKNKDYLWIKFLDGTQTAPDPFLMAKFGAHGERPWRPTMIGRGCQIVILTSRYNTDLFKGVPAGLFEPHPLPLYDVRKDSSVGGNGGHRWADPSTWEPSINPAVMIYNLARGVYYGPEWVYGGQNIGAFCLPAANWMAAANACDASVPLDGGGSEPAYRAGYDVQCDQEPLDAVSELLKGCNGRMAEVGGIFKMLVGSPGGAVYSFTDDDVVVTEEQDFQPFPSLSATYNSIEATYPEPAEKWATKDAPGRYNADLEVQDGNRRLPAEIQLLAVPFANQVQRVGLAMIQDYRRFRVHQISLPPDAYPLEPNDVVSWSSVRNGYDEKKFLVVKVEPQPNFLIVVTLKEVDPADYDWHPGLQLPTAIGWLGPITPPSQPMIGWTVEPSTIKDAGGIDRRPAIKISCAPDLDDVRGVWVQVRVKASGDVVFDSDSNPYALPFSWIISGQWTLPNAEYEVRGRYLPQSNRATDWSAWLTVKTPNVLIQASDVLDGAIVQSKIADAAVSAAKIMDEAVSNVKLANQAVSTAKLQVAAVTADVLASGAVISAKLADGAVTAAKLAQGAVDATSLASSIKAVEVVAALPTTSNIEGRQVFLTTDGKLYRYHNGAWTAAVAAVDVNGTLNGSQIADNAITSNKLAALAVDATKFASGIRPVEIVSSLPTTGNIAGRTVYLTTDGKLYRYTGSAWTAATAAVDVAGQIIGTQISDGAVAAPKLAAGSVTADKIAANSITAGQITAGAIGAAQIAAKAITAEKLLIANLDNMIDLGFTTGSLGAWTPIGQNSYYLETTAGSPMRGTYLVNCDARDQLCFGPALIRVSPGESYNISVWFYNVDTAFDAFMGVYIKDQAGINVAPNWIGLSANAAKGVWTQMQGNFTVPAGVYQVQPTFGVAKLSANGKNCIWGKPNMRRAASAELIIDGAVTAGKVAADAITTKAIAIGDFSNLITNPFFDQGTNGVDGWILGGGISPLRMVGMPGDPAPNYLRIPDCRGAIDYAVFDPGLSIGGSIPCAAGDGYYVEFYIRKSGVPTAPFGAYLSVSDRSSTNTVWPQAYFATAIDVPLSWTRVQALVNVPATVANNGIPAKLNLQLTVRPGTANNAGSYDVAKPVVRRATGAVMIEDGAVTASKVAANAITVGNIAANAVTAGTIAAGAVSAAQIAAGAVTADKLAAGSVSAQALAVGSGKNLLQNASFTMGTDCWVIAYQSGAIPNLLFRVRSVTESWAGPNCPTLVLYQGSGPTGFYADVCWIRPDIPTAVGFLKLSMPCAPGECMEASVYVAAHRCTVELRIAWVAADGSAIGYTTAAQNVGVAGSSTNPDLWPRLRVIGAAPANTVAAAIHIRKLDTNAGSTDSYMFMNKPMLCRASVSAAEPTPWSDGGVVLITNGGIAANAVTADKIAANAVTAGKIAASAVTAGTIAAGAVTATTITGGAITGDKLAANTIGAGQIAANAITAKQLVLTDFSNMADNGWQTGTLDGWVTQNTQAFYLDTVSGDAAGYVLQSLGRDCSRSNFVAVTVGETYSFDVWVYNTDTNPASIYAALLTPSGVWGFTVVASTSVKNVWVRLQGRYTVASGYTKLAMLLQVDKTAGTGNSCYWSKPVMRRAASAELIVDGAITANKIAANSITADKLNINSLDAITANIGNLQVGTSNIVGGAITRVDTGLPEGAAGINANSGPIPVTGITCMHGAGSPSILVLSSFSLSNNGSNPNNYFTQVEVHIWDNANNRYTAVLPFSFYGATSFTHSFSFRPPADRTETQFRFDVKPINLPSLGSPPLLINNRIINALTLKR